MKNFWNYVDIGSYDNCWEWTGSKSGTGYGITNINNGVSRITIRNVIHRKTWRWRNE